MLMAVMELDHVEAFVAIVRRGGFTRASAALHLSQPAISRRVHLLEGELGPVCSPHHRLVHARRVDAKALAGERWITFPVRPGAAPEPYASALERGLALVGASPSEIIPIDSLTAQKRMVEAGFGLALLQESSVNEELRVGTLHA